MAQSSATPEEAAAIAAAIEQFLRDTAPVAGPPETPPSPWQRAGLLENAGLDPGGHTPWGDGEVWGA